MRIALILTFILFYTPTSAQIGGDAAFEFLQLPSSARVAALGGNTIAAMDQDITAGYQNPAFLNPEMDKQVSVNNSIYFSGINFGYAGIAKNYDSLGTFSAGIQYITYGSFDQSNSNGDVTGKFMAGDQALHLGWGKQKDEYSFGANLKLATSFLESYFSAGALLDIGGAYYNPDKRFTAFLVVKNLGWQIIPYIKGNREPLPFDIQAGISKRLEHLPFRFYLTAHHLYTFDIRYNDPSVNENQSLIIDSTQKVKEKKYIADKIFRHLTFGGEFEIGDHLVLRGSYDHLRRQEMKTETRNGLAGFSFGAGIKLTKFQIDYTLTSYHLAGLANYFSFSTNLSEWSSK